MKEFLNPNTIANDARMRRATFTGSFLFVEGPSDEKLYGIFIDKSHCQMIITYGRPSLLQTCAILEQDGFTGFLGIIDADFDHLDLVRIESQNVFHTDLHDGECSMLATSAFMKLLGQLAVQSKLAAWTALYGSDVRRHLLQEAAKIGFLLWYSKLNGLNLHFELLKTKEYADSSSLTIDVNLLVRHVKNKSSRRDLTDDYLIDGIHERMSITTELWQVVRGHDFIDLFAFGLRNAIGNWKALDVTRDRLELELRLAYSDDHFAGTGLFREIRAWEASHPPFRVLCLPRQEQLHI